ncbi:autophagy-related protein 17 [Haloplanus pelagicus]|uniref:autophagy-related protein 17 n=1 Tax=Haloplanus pelagicus TaxID=2949995 RepID=UPI0020425F11|nr:autophagy-related protein 17 [Haloplanus sp. HW8-1]
MDVDPMDTARAEPDRTEETTEAEATANIVATDGETDDAADGAEIDDVADGAETDDAADGAEIDDVADGAETDDVDAVEPLTITLPDGSESVSEAILSHRRMLTNPADHGLVSADEADEVLDTIEELAEEVPEDLRDDLADLEASVEGLTERLDRQDRQIGELQETVESLADILGASVEFQHRDGA